VTIYLLEIMGLGLILFLVAMVCQQSEIGSRKSTSIRRYHVTLEESEYISFLELALERAQSRLAVEPKQKTTAK
jgi:hypothetical protein